VIRASIFAPPKDEESEATEPKTYEIFRQRYNTVPWKGWYNGEAEDIEKISPAFISELEAQALPRAESLEKIISKEALWPPDLDA
jgi:hypothetical protein